MVKIIFILWLLTSVVYTQENINTTLVGRWAGGPCTTMDVVDDLVYLGRGGYLQIADVSDPAHPVELGKLIMPSPILDISVSGDYAFAAAGLAGLRVIDISDPLNPCEISYLESDESPEFYYDLEIEKVKIINNDAYLYQSDGTMRFIDISDVQNMVELGRHNPVGYIDFVISGNLMFSTNWDGMHIADIKDPENPFDVAYYEIEGGVKNIAVADDFAFITTESAGLQIIDISNPTSPTDTSFYQLDEQAYSIVFDSGYVFIATESGFRIIDVHNPHEPAEIAAYPSDFIPLDMKIVDGYLFMAARYYSNWSFRSNLYVLDIADLENPFEVSRIETGGITLDVKICNDYAYTLEVLDYFDSFRIRIIDISNKQEPVSIGFQEFHGIPVVGGWEINNQYIYLGFDTSFVVLEITDSLTFSELARYNPGGSIRNFTINNNYAFLAIDNSAYRSLIFSTPTYRKQLATLKLVKSPLME